MRSLATRALRAELRVYTSIGRAIARRPAIRLPDDATATDVREVTSVRLWADDPQRFIQTARPFLERYPVAQRDRLQP